MSAVAWAAFVLSFLALLLFIISNYKSVINNIIQFLLVPDLKIRLESGSITSEDGKVTVGGSPDSFQQELIELQELQEDEIIEIPLSQLQHPDDHSEVDHFDIRLLNNSNREYEGKFTVIADILITNRHPNISENIHSMSESYLQLKKEPAPPATIFDSETLMSQRKYEFNNKVVSSDGTSGFSWYINRDILTEESEPISEFEIKTKFEPRLAPSNFPWWIPEFVGSVELRPVEKTFLIKDEVNAS